MEEGGSISEKMEECNEVEIGAGPLEPSVKFHVVKDVIGFILYMHQQIPSVLQDLKLEFEALQIELKELESYGKQNEVKSLSRRFNLGKTREVKYGIKRLQKLMTATAQMEAALQLLLNVVPNVQYVLLILGASSMRPQHVYEMCFSHESDFSAAVSDFAKTKVAEGLSRKAIRMLISRGAGSSSYGGERRVFNDSGLLVWTSQSKLFLVVKAPSSFSLPHHFLPKRDFRYSKKVVPVRLRLKCRLEYQQTSDQNHASQPSRRMDFDDNSIPFIWFQCRHVIKGISFNLASTED